MNLAPEITLICGREKLPTVWYSNTDYRLKQQNRTAFGRREQTQHTHTNKQVPSSRTAHKIWLNWSRMKQHIHTNTQQQKIKQKPKVMMKFQPYRLHMHARQNSHPRKWTAFNMRQGVVPLYNLTKQQYCVRSFVIFFRINCRVCVSV